jgi:hypothetical protein
MFFYALILAVYTLAIIIIIIQVCQFDHFLIVGLKTFTLHVYHTTYSISHCTAHTTHPSSHTNYSSYAYIHVKLTRGSSLSGIPLTRTFSFFALKLLLISLTLVCLCFISLSRLLFRFYFPSSPLFLRGILCVVFTLYQQVHTIIWLWAAYISLFDFIYLPTCYCLSRWSILAVSYSYLFLCLSHLASISITSYQRQWSVDNWRILWLAN